MSATAQALQPAEAAMVESLWKGSFICLAVMGAVALMVAPWHSAISVWIGGVIAIVNLAILKRTVLRSFMSRDKSGLMGRMLFKYYLRFGATALLLLALVSQGWVEPLGLLVGLSVVVFTIFAWGAMAARKLHKEAV